MQHSTYQELLCYLSVWYNNSGAGHYIRKPFATYAIRAHDAGATRLLFDTKSSLCRDHYSLNMHTLSWYKYLLQHWESQCAFQEYFQIFLIFHDSSASPWALVCNTNISHMYTRFHDSTLQAQCFRVSIFAQSTPKSAL